MIIKNKFQIEEASSLTGIERKIIVQWIENEWITPVDLENHHLDDEDIARARLIHNLIQDFGVNDEGISIVLHLIDQLHYLRNQLKNL